MSNSNATSTSLKNLITLQRGFDLPGQSRKEGGVPVVASSGTVGWHNESKVTAPGVVIGRSGSIGGGQYVSQDFWPLNTTLWVKDFKGNEPRFIYYLLRSIDFSSFNAGVGVPTLNRNHIASLKAPRFSLSKQQRIASILSAYDDLIENNRRRIALLEEAARLLYREWFVHFRFPGHEHVKIINGAPEGWEIKKVGDLLARVKAKTTVRKDEYQEEGEYPCVDQGQSFIGGYTDNSEAIYRDELPLIVFGDHTRALKFVDFPFARGADGTQICRSNDHRLSQEMFYWSLVNIDLSNYFYARHFKFLKDQEVIIPSQPLADDFTRFARDNFRQIKALRQQSTELAKARDLLLPRLMDGRLEVYA
jgi:type I restriction enzyme S subunit